MSYEQMIRILRSGREIDFGHDIGYPLLPVASGNYADVFRNVRGEIVRFSYRVKDLDMIEFSHFLFIPDIHHQFYVSDSSICDEDFCVIIRDDIPDLLEDYTRKIHYCHSDASAILSPRMDSTTLSDIVPSIGDWVESFAECEGGKKKRLEVFSGILKEYISCAESGQKVPRDILEPFFEWSNDESYHAKLLVLQFLLRMYGNTEECLAIAKLYLDVMTAFNDFPIDFTPDNLGMKDGQILFRDPYLMSDAALTVEEVAVIRMR